MKLFPIIPVYNGAKKIGPLVAEVEKHLADRFDLEIVLENDGSPADNSAVVVGLSLAAVALVIAAVALVDLLSPPELPRGGASLLVSRLLLAVVGLMAI
ncbi:MAG: hypothetical protein ACUVWX_10030, partial [Kiritimatiellia bacterium]